MAKIKLAADFSDFLKLCLRNQVHLMVIGGYAVILEATGGFAAHRTRPDYKKRSPGFRPGDLDENS